MVGNGAHEWPSTRVGRNLAEVEEEVWHIRLVSRGRLGVEGSGEPTNESGVLMRLTDLLSQYAYHLFKGTLKGNYQPSSSNPAADTMRPRYARIGDAHGALSPGGGARPDDALLDHIGTPQNLVLRRAGAMRRHTYRLRVAGVDALVEQVVFAGDQRVHRRSPRMSPQHLQHVRPLLRCERRAAGELPLKVLLWHCITRVDRIQLVLIHHIHHPRMSDQLKRSHQHAPRHHLRSIAHVDEADHHTMVG